MARGWPEAAEWGAGPGHVSALDPLTWPSQHQAGPSAVTAMLTWGLQRGVSSWLFPVWAGKQTSQTPRMGGGPLLCSMCSLWKGIETRQHGERKRNDLPPGLPGILPGARTIRQLLPCPRPRPEPENSPGGCRLGRGPRKPGRDMPSQHRPRGRAAGGPCPCPNSRWGWALWLPKDARSHFPRKFCKGLGNVRLFLF